MIGVILGLGNVWIGAGLAIIGTIVSVLAIAHVTLRG